MNLHNQFGACVVLLSLVTCFAWAAEPDAPPNCANAITQAEMNRCADEDFLDASAEYAAAYQALYRQLAADRQKKLQRMQKAWLQYRTAACVYETSAVAGGSAEAMLRIRCAARLSRERAAELRALGSCREGDLACAATSQPILQHSAP